MKCFEFDTQNTITFSYNVVWQSAVVLSKTPTFFKNAEKRFDNTDDRRHTRGPTPGRSRTSARGRSVSGDLRGKHLDAANREPFRKREGLIRLTSLF
jgi:hypothetical protein